MGTNLLVFIPVVTSEHACHIAAAVAYCPVAGGGHQPHSIYTRDPHLTDYSLNKGSSTAELLARTGQANMADHMRRHRVRWLGHAARKPNDVMVKQQVKHQETPFVHYQALFHH